MHILLLFPILLPMIGGLLLLCVRPLQGKISMRVTSGIGLGLTALFVLLTAQYDSLALPVFTLTDKMTLVLKMDGVGRLFAVLISLVFLAVGIYSFEYLKHEEREHQFMGFYLLTLGALMGLCFAGSLITFYFFYEMMTLLSLPLVLHERTPEAVAAGKKYLYFSCFGALCGLFGIFALAPYASTLEFMAGGTLKDGEGGAAFVLAVTFVMILGFGVKAGLFPLHSWLPTAHPVAPAPASAVLSGLIAKAGVLGIIRTVFYIVGADTLRGSWVQIAWMILALITVVMGSTMAFREDVLKKRLAYSTVSQLSYILLGLSCLNTEGFVGALSHVVFHALIKSALFLVAGSIIFKTGCTKVSQLHGIGKKMPITMWGWTLVSLGLIGIPPTSGFISKWHLGQGSLDAGLGALDYIGPVCLIISALLTAIYLLQPVISGFFVGKDGYKDVVDMEPSSVMWVPIIVLAAASVLYGIFPDSLLRVIQSIAAGILL